MIVNDRRPVPWPDRGIEASSGNLKLQSPQTPPTITSHHDAAACIGTYGVILYPVGRTRILYLGDVYDNDGHVSTCSFSSIQWLSCSHVQRSCVRGARSPENRVAYLPSLKWLF